MRKVRPEPGTSTLPQPCLRMQTYMTKRPAFLPEHLVLGCKCSFQENPCQTVQILLQMQMQTREACNPGRWLTQRNLTVKHSLMR